MSELEAVRELTRAALAALERSRARIDDLNVFPVPDGDTGTNLTLTMRAVVDALNAAEDSDRVEIAHAATRAALLGARGNSGVILSQIVRGASDALSVARPIDSAVLAGALRSASDAAYRAVRVPVEGTMLTVIRELAEGAERRCAGPCENAALLNDLISDGEAALARTRELLPALRDAGVVDAGGAGLLELLRGVAAHVSGESLPELEKRDALPLDAIHRELSRYRYCTVFLIEGDALDAGAIESRLEELGDSLLVVGDEQALRVHVHTDEPGDALSIGTAVGVVDRVEIANMHEQTRERTGRLLHALPDASPAVTAVVAVASGAGNRALFESLGVAQVIEGGQTMNPSVGELAEAIDRLNADEVIVLPNNANVVEAAQQAARAAQTHARVVPTTSIQQGLSAMVPFDPDKTSEQNAAAMVEAGDAVTTGAITIAARAATVNGLAVREGEYLGLAEGDAIIAGAVFEEVATAVADRLLALRQDVLTLLTGADEPELAGLLDRLAERYPELEVDVQQGGQPHYPLLLAAE